MKKYAFINFTGDYNNTSNFIIIRYSKLRKVQNVNDNVLKMCYSWDSDDVPSTLRIIYRTSENKNSYKINKVKNTNYILYKLIDTDRYSLLTIIRCDRLLKFENDAAARLYGVLLEEMQ